MEHQSTSANIDPSMIKDMTPNKTTTDAFFKDLICGSVAGLTVCLSGHPLDSMKVRMQNSLTKLTFTGVISQTYRHEGVLGFYKGMGPPLVTVPLINSIVFASYELCKRQLGVVSDEDFTFKQSMLSGMFAGLVNSVVLSPIELVKCRL
jgi:hypothetical protein